MYAQVVVPSYKGPNEDGFTYEVPAGLKVQPGQLVLVPFGRVREIGIVLSCHPERNEGSKTGFPIRSGMTEKEILRSAPADAKALAGRQNDEADSGQARMTGKIVIRPIDSVVFDKPFLLPYQIELLHWMAKYYLAGIGNCANAILPQLPNAEGLKTNANSLSRSSLVLNQTLVLVPTINNIPQTMALFPKATRPLVFHSELKPQEKLEAWLKVLAGQADYVFGTRQAVFLPYPKLRKIVIINEHDDSYKDQRSPYYDTLTIAEKVSQLTKAKIEVIDPAPKITTFFPSEDKKRFNLVLRTRKNLKEPGIKIVSMAEERKVGNKTAISDELKYQIEENLKNSGNTLLYLNKKKESGTLYCNNCKYQEALPKEPEKCPSCGSEQIFFASLNIGSLAKQVQKIFPKTKINLITDSTYHPTIPPSHYPVIDIATSAVFYKLLPRHYSLVAAISMDSALNVPEYTAPEKAYVLVTTLKRLAGKILILQTYSPESPILEVAANSNYERFYQEQLEQRKTLLYPPFSILVKLVVKGKNEEKTLAKAEKLVEDLTHYLLPTTYYILPTVLGPFESYFRKTSKTYNIVIKIPLKSYALENRGKAVESIKPALQEANATRVADQIVVDPASLN